MTDKQVIIDGLFCDNCPEAQRCQEQRAKKEYAINQVLQDVPSEYANVIDRLKQIIPSITRCDYVLEKQLKRKEQECKKLKKELASFMNGDYCANGCSLKQQLDKLKETLAEIKEIAEECYYKCNSMNNCNISCKYYNDCNGEFSYLLAYLNKQISEVEDEN